MIDGIVFYCNPTGYKVFGLLSLICMILVYDAEGMQMKSQPSRDHLCSPAASSLYR